MEVYPHSGKNATPGGDVVAESFFGTTTYSIQDFKVSKGLSLNMLDRQHNGVISKEANDVREEYRKLRSKVLLSFVLSFACFWSFDSALSPSFSSFRGLFPHF